MTAKLRRKYHGGNSAQLPQVETDGSFPPGFPTQSAINSFVRDTGARVASQLEACTRCGMCAEACHYYQATGKPEYAPIWKVELLRRAYEQRFTLTGKLKLRLGIEHEITDEEIAEWPQYSFGACSMCNKCSLVCPMGIDLKSLIGEVRSGLTAAGCGPERLVQRAHVQAETGSPAGYTEKEWGEFFHSLDGTGIEVPIDKQGANSLVVFTSIELEDYPENLRDIARIMNAAGESWTVSLQARDAFNLGTIIGDKAVQRTISDRLVNAAKALGVKRIVVTECGHGFTTLRDEYPNNVKERLPFTIEHITEVMAEFFRKGRIKLQPGLFDDGRVLTFHDSCKIQRTGGIMEEPRLIINHLAPKSFVEMPNNRTNAICCGGGGGIRGIPDARPNVYAAFGLKVKDVKAINADGVITTCSNCRVQFNDGFRHYGMSEEVYGLVGMVAAALIEK